MMRLKLGQRAKRAVNHFIGHFIGQFVGQFIGRLRQIVTATVLQPSDRLTSRLLIGLFGLGMVMPLAIAPIAKAQLPPSNSRELLHQAQQLNQQSRYEEAIPLLQQAVRQFSEQQDLLNQATALGNLASVYAHVNHWTEANLSIQHSLRLLQSASPTLDQQRILAYSLEIQGTLQFEQGRAEDALASWTQAAASYEALRISRSSENFASNNSASETLSNRSDWGDPSGNGAADRLRQTQLNQVQALQTLGLKPRACRTLLAALQLPAQTCQISPETLALLDRSPVSVLLIRALNDLGHILRVLGQLDDSQQVLTLALQQAQQINDAQGIAAVSLHLGNTWQAIANQPTLDPEQVDSLQQAALEVYQQAAQQATQVETQIQAQLNQLSVWIQRADWTAAQALWQALHPQLSRLPTNRSGIVIRINLTQRLLQLAARSPTHEAFRDLESLLTQTLEQTEALGDPRLQAYALNNRATWYELQQQWSSVEAIANQALALAPPFQAPDVAYQTLWQLGRVNQAEGKRTEAIAHYSRAVDALRSLRGDLVATNSDVQFSFRESVEPIYRQLVSLLLDETAPSDEHLRQARQVIESLQLAELDNFFRDACADATPRSIDEVDGNAAVLYPIILSDRLEVILTLPGQELQHYVIRQPQAVVEQTVRQARNALRPTAFAQEYLPPAQQLYDWLIRPAELTLAEHGIQTLVFVLDGALRNLPMATLHDGHQFLIERYSLALTPGLQLLSPQPLRSRSLQALIGGLSEANQGFSALPAVEQEVSQASREVASEVLLNQQFTQLKLQQQITDNAFSIVHLATHGQFSSSADQTFLLTWNDRLTVRHLDRLLASRDMNNSRPIELLILSACQTAAGDQRATLGMAGFAVRSGARSTVASLWLVNDQPTAELITEFYHQFTQQQVNRAEALRQAQLKLLANPESQHPFYWAAFILVGNWL